MKYCTQCGVPVGEQHKRLNPFRTKKMMLSDELKQKLKDAILKKQAMIGGGA